MLVLARTVNQEVVIRTPEGREIRVMLCDIRNMYRVKLGFTADTDVTIYRGEIQDDIDRRTGGV